MSLLRHFRRGTFGAAAGALVLPFALFGAALAVGLGGGGLGGLRQIVSGPAAPVDTPLSRSTSQRSPGQLLARVRPAAPSPVQGAVQGATGGPTASGERGGGSRTPVASIDQPGSQTIPAGEAPAAPASPQPAAPTAAPTSPPSAVRQVGDTVKSVTDRVPVVGTPVGQVVDDLVDTVDSITP